MITIDNKNFEIVNKKEENFSIWNIGFKKYNNNYYIVLARKDEECNIDLNNLKLFQVENEQDAKGLTGKAKGVRHYKSLIKKYNLY